MKVYYSHCVNIYNTPQEARDIKLLESLGFEVINPNLPEHAAHYPVEGMGYFVALVVGCDAFAFRALPDGRIPAGVAMETAQAIACGHPIIELPSRMLSRVISVMETREYLKEVGQR
jgi:hypothetical protein